MRRIATGGTAVVLALAVVGLARSAGQRVERQIL
jgi:hypothetical protein